MIDLIMWSLTKQNLVTFAETYGLRVQSLTPIMDEDPDSPTFGEQIGTIDNGWTNRPGFEYNAWNNSGKFMSKDKDVRSADLVVEVVQEYVPAVPAVTETDPETLEVTIITPAVPAVPAEFAFRIGSQTPTWLDDTVTAWIGNKAKGRFLRKEGQFAVFSGVAQVDDVMTIYTPATPEYLDGFVYLVRLSATIAADDQEIDETETGQFRRSKIARLVKHNGTLGDIAGITYAEVDGVRIFKPDDVAQWLSDRALIPCEYQGGNNY